MTTRRKLRTSPYVGADRCWPCTVVNLLALGLVCMALAIRTVPAAVGVGTLGTFLVWWRGYIVPYTPRFASKMVSFLPVDPFDHNPTVPSTVTDDAPNVDDETVLAELGQSNVLNVDESGVALTEGFREHWTDRMTALRKLDSQALPGAVLDSAPSATNAELVEQDDRTYVVLSDDSDNIAGETWVRRPNAIAETAAIEALRTEGIRHEVRVVAPSALKLFLESCPACTDALTEKLAGSCCGQPLRNTEGKTNQALVCESCDVHLAVFE